MKATDLINRLQYLVKHHGDQEVSIDTGMTLCVVDDVDLGSSDEGVIIWAGDLVEGEQ